MRPLRVRPPSGSGGAQSIRGMQIEDFRGGLNLTDAINRLQPNETPDCLNVDFHARGGVQLRGGMRFQNQTPISLGAANVLGYWRHESDDTAAEFYEVAHGAATSSSTVIDAAGVAQSNNSYGDVNGPLVAVQFNGLTYITGHEDDAQFYWDPEAGVTHTALVQAGVNGNGWTDQLAGPFYFPQAQAVAVWDNRVWAANTVEDTVAHKSRLRFSVNGSGVDWNSNDYIDIDVGEDGDGITALGVHGEVLVVFKQRSMYAILPDDTTVFRVVQINAAVGATGPYAVAPSPLGLWFWDGHTGLHLWRSTEPQFAGTKIYQALEEGRIPFDDEVHLSWSGERVWCSVTLDGTRENLTYDPTLSAGGAWSRYNPGILGLLRIGGEHMGFSQNISGSSLSAWLKVDQRTAVDDFGGGDQTIVAHWVSAWFNAGSFNTRKRWRRPHFLVAAPTTVEIPVSVQKDYDPRTDKANFFLSVRDEDNGAASVYGTSQYGTQTYGLDDIDETFSDDVNGPSLGEAKSLRLRLSNPTTSVRWRLDAISLPHIQRPFRG